MATRRFIVTSIAFLMAAPVLAQTSAGSVGTGHESYARDISGRYLAKGRNPDGSAYTGTCDVVQSGNSVTFNWVISGAPNTGHGTIDGRVVTVDWGDATPVLYVITDGGALHGTWSDGTALDRLTRQ